METKMLTYLLHAAICLSAFYVIYRLLLRNSTHFVSNRIYLVSALCLSMVLPLINVPQLALTSPASDIVQVSPAVSQPSAEPAFIESPTNPGAFEITQMLFWLYISGVIIMLIRFTIMGLSLWKIYRSARIQSLYGVRAAATNTIKTPASFMNLLFTPASGLSATELEKIVAHERVHMRQRHTLDLLLAEVVVLAQWFNPLAWLLKRELKNVHEYLADQGALRGGINADEYQKALLSYAAGERRLALVHPFATAGVRNRIEMINKRRSSPRARWKMLSLIPVAALLLTAWAAPEATEEQTRTIKGTVYRHDGADPLAKADVMVKGMGITAVSKKDGTYRLDGVPHGAAVLVFFSREDGFLTVPIAPGDTLVDVALRLKQPSMYRKGPGSPWLTAEASREEFTEEFTTDTDSLRPLFIIDGERSDSKNEFKTLRPEDIQTIEVKKGKETVREYGRDARHGVVLIETRRNRETREEKNEDSPTPGNEGKAEASTGAGQPLYIVDGKRVENLEGYQASQIDKLEVLKGREAVSKYGEAARHGAIIVTTR